MSQPKDDAENYADILAYGEQRRFQVPGMSQERTAGQYVGEAWTKIQVLRDEIDRLNAENANLTAKVQRRDNEIYQVNIDYKDLRQTLARYFGDAKTVQEYERTEDELRAELDAATAEIERLRRHEQEWKANHKEDIEENSRLRAALLNSRGDFQQILRGTRETEAANIARSATIDIETALKGAE